MQDADNLGWKLTAVLKGEAPERLIDSYEAERMPAADENILNSTRSTDFISPKSETSRLFRDAVLALAEEHDFARPLINSGRLSVASVYDGSPLCTGDALLAGPARTRPGTACPDAPLGEGFLLDRLGGGFTLLALGVEVPDGEAPCPVLAVDPEEALRERYLGSAPVAVYLIRPDQHVAARWDRWDPAAVSAALDRSMAREVA